MPSPPPRARRTLWSRDFGGPDHLARASSFFLRARERQPAARLSVDYLWEDDRR